MGAAALVRHLGNDPLAIAATAGLPARALMRFDTPLPARTVARFLECAARRCRTDTFGLQLATAHEFSIIPPLWERLRAASTPEELLRALENRLQAEWNSLHVELQADGEGVACIYHIDTGGRPARQALELGFATLVMHLRSRLPRGWRPRELKLRHAPPRDGSLHARIFGPAVRFGADRDALVLDAATLRMPLFTRRRSARALLGEVLPPAGGAWLDEALPQRLLVQLRVSLPRGTPTLGAIAGDLGLSTRTLQRRLLDCGSAYQQQLDAARADLALEYLGDPELALGEVAERLGYRRHSAFSRACQRWHGETPSELRSRLGAAEPRRGRGPSRGRAS